MNQPQVGLGQALRNALSLNANFYENTPNTVRTRKLARTIVLLAAISHALGSALILLINRASAPILLLLLVMDALSVIAGYYFWAFSIWQLGRWLKRHSLALGDLLVPIGFAYAPQVLNFLTLIPLLGRPIELGLAVWSLLAIVVAVRQGLDIRTVWSVAICLVGWSLVQSAIGFVQVFEQYLVRITS